MPQIELLNQETIDKIAAGEVIERPCSVVKELVENAIDAGANVITVEIKEGGISFIRITDNGCGMEKEQIPLAFLRHSTSKIKSVEDLLTVKSLGFRGEALSSIAAVSQVELITKSAADFTGSRYLIEGSKEISLEEIGAPDGTTFLVRNLFYNTPARKKFLKTPQTEGSYIHELMQHMILSHPDVAFKFIMNNQVKLQSSGNSNIKDIIYHLYGRDITNALLPVEYECADFKVSGFVGKPQISRGNRSYEIYFINGRYIKSNVIAKAIEDAYKPFLMQHQYPMTVLYFTIDSSLLDINVHPTKMEIRFANQQEIYTELTELLGRQLMHKERIPEVPLQEEKTAQKNMQSVDAKHIMPEPFEKTRLDKIREAIRKDSPYEPKYEAKFESRYAPENETVSAIREEETYQKNEQTLIKDVTPSLNPVYVQGSFLDENERAKQKVIGQLFDTYWLVEYNDKLFIVDQHAAHEKVLYEQLKKQLSEKEFTSQAVSPPVVVTLSMQEADALERYRQEFERLGFEIDHFGGMEYSICSLPDNLYTLNAKDILVEMLDELTDGVSGMSTPEIILDKIATMACKAAVKGNQKLSPAEMEELMKNLMKLENPYNCPHGRPTIISMSKYEIEKKFKRIV